MELRPEAQLTIRPSTPLRSEKLIFSTQGASAENSANNSRALGRDHLHAEDSCCLQLELELNRLKNNSVDAGLNMTETLEKFVVQEDNQDLNLLISPQEYCGPSLDPKGEDLSCCSQLEVVPKERKDSSFGAGLGIDHLAEDLLGQRNAPKDQSLLSSPKDSFVPQPVQEVKGEDLPEVSCCYQFGPGQNRQKGISVWDGLDKADLVEGLFSQGLQISPHNRCSPYHVSDQRLDDHLQGGRVFSQTEVVPELLKDTSVCICLNNPDVVVDTCLREVSVVLGDESPVLGFLSLPHARCGPCRVQDPRATDHLPGPHCCSQLEPGYGLKDRSVCVYLSDFVEPQGQVSVVLQEFEPQNCSVGTVELNCEDGNVELKTLSNGHVSQTSEDGLIISSPTPNSRQESVELPRIIKHKQSSITFLDYAKCRTCVKSSSDHGESSGDDVFYDQADEEDDVFLELPPGRELRANRGLRKDSGKKRSYCINGPTGSDICGYEAEAESSSKEVSLQLKAPWSESMSQLLRKLDELNLDIEEALSAGSSPSDTPCTARKSQCPASNRSLNGRGQRSEWSSQSGSCVPRGASIGTRTRSKKAVYNKMASDAGAEVEAKEACDWLRAAGFPQYAQLFEDSQFPIDISPVKRDHDFLDKDLVEPLCRRLNTLNKCASLKLDVNLPKKKSEDSDEEDLFAISDKWTFEWSSRRWSRLQDIDGLLGNQTSEPSAGDNGPLRTTTSSESVLTDLSEPEVSSVHSESSGGSGPRGLSAEDSDCSTRTCSDSVAMPDSTLLTMSHIAKDISHYGSLRHKHGKTSRTRAKDFLKRMETLRSRGALGRGRKNLVISSPVLQQEAHALKTLPCAEILNGDGRPPEPPSHKVLSQSGSEGSSHYGGSAGSTPSLKERKPCRADHKRSGMYLEDVDIFSGNQVAEQNRRNEFCSYEDLVVHIPNDHKPGTFPKALSIESLSPTNGGSINWHRGSMHLDSSLISCRQEARPVTQCCSRGSRISVYDNVPGSHLYASTGDLIDLEKEDLFPHLDDILMHVSGLQQIVDHWSKNILPGGEGLPKVEGAREEASQITLDFEADSVVESQTTPSAGDGVSLSDIEATRLRERRDSGVGASLTRPNRLRWPSFQISNRLSLSVASLQITNQSAGQLSLLQKFSLLRLTAIMEKYSLSNKHGWTWAVPKFMKRMKVPDYKDKNVFGVPLIVQVQRSGQPLPPGLQQALRYLRSQCLDQVGLFRKSGVKSRIQALRQLNESSPDNVNYDDQSAYDVADMVKQFFRDLPEPLLTSKLGETFLHIYQYVPKDQRLQAVQAAIMLMSDENREVLQTLLCFLSDVTSSVEENQMTPMNIAVCLAPSLFHLNILKKDNLSPRAMQKKYASGRPDQKDLNENLAATQGLAHMITECNRLFEIPHEMVTQSRNSYVEADLHAPTFEELFKQLEDDNGTHDNHMDGRLENLLKEAREKSKYWVSCSSSDSTELSYKKMGDGNPLRRWRVSVEVEAPPSVVLNRVLRERHLWDVDLLQWKVCETLDKQTEVFQYVLNRMPPHPSRDFVVLRSWRTDLPKGACSLVSVSIEHEDCPPVGAVRAIVLESNYLLEPCGSGKSRLTHICRVDLKGRTPEWYNKAFGHICAAEAARIRNSFQPLIADGPETKI
ncbi:stAR-related lipid transfer protein 13 isoform X2 [Syngnathoides biaculeatus]|uniref:stAR-related lipid transfer protein 13 isoform X2 n=1 Tax=Syngnathoides biaculeatus TaxID=300417 RepID=UPI002ADD6684|nr:stAR-related lipid transfer protein 13 isoform X2 [Syngnathoides biaculeatus]